MSSFTHSPSRRVRVKTSTLAGVMAACLSLAPAAVAQDARPAETYPAEFFAPYAPQTALDMISHLPGFRLDTGDESVRGFSESGGNVLIDGERPATKAGGLATAISSIAADQVSHIEIIRGGVATGDTSGRSVVANIVRIRGQKSLAMDAEFSLMDGYPLGRASMVATHQFGDYSLTSQARLDAQGELSHGARSFFDGGGGLTRLDDLTYETANPELSGRLTMTGPLAGGRITANAMLARARLAEAFTFVDGALVDRFPKRTHRWRGELGADWTRPLNGDYALNLLALTNFADVDAREFSLAGNAGQALRETLLFENRFLSRETILRAVLTRGGEGAWRPEIGAEIARNVLDSESLLTEYAPSFSHPASGILVSETRLEAFATMNWLPSPRWAVVAGAAYEASRIRAEDQAVRENRFEFLRPRLMASYKPDEQTDVRLSLRRTVGQLSFGDFAASVRLLDGMAFDGNPDLGPDHKTTLAFDYDRRFGERGALNLNIFHDWRGDVLESAILSSGAYGVRNVGEARAWGLSANLEAPLDAVIPGGLVRLGYRRMESRVTDPVTGDERRLSSTHPRGFEVGFRQDLISSRTAWGFQYSRGVRTRTWYIDELRAHDHASKLGAFVETTRYLDARMRLSVDSASGVRNTFHRSLYNPDRSGAYSHSEVWDIRSPTTVTFSISRNF